MNQEFPLHFNRVYFQVHDDIDCLKQQLLQDHKSGHITNTYMEKLVEQASTSKLFIYDFKSNLNSSIIIGIYKPRNPERVDLDRYATSIVSMFIGVVQALVTTCNINFKDIVYSHWWIYLTEDIFSKIVHLNLDSDTSYRMVSPYQMVKHLTVYRTACYSIISTADAVTSPDLNTKLGIDVKAIPKFFKSDTHQGKCLTSTKYMWGVAMVKVERSTEVDASALADIISTHYHELTHYVSNLMCHYEDKLDSLGLLSVWKNLMGDFVANAIRENLGNWEAEEGVVEECPIESVSELTLSQKEEPVNLIDVPFGGTVFATIKEGAIISHDMLTFVWPDCLPPKSEYGVDTYQARTKYPNIIFTCVCKGTHWDCTAPGYGITGDYGNGSIYVLNRDDLDVV